MLPMYKMIYNWSRIDFEEFYMNVAMLTYKTNNSHKDLCSMEYWKFNNFVINFNKIMESEEGDGKDKNGGNEEFMNTVTSSQNKITREAKNTFNSIKK